MRMVNEVRRPGISLRHGIAIYISSVLGGGILILPGLAADAAGPSSILAWIILSVASFPFAYTFSRLAMRSRVSGGIYAFTREAFGNRTGNSVGWLFLAWVALGAPAVAVAAGTYLSYAISMNRVEIFTVAFILILSVTVINNRGIRFSANLQLFIIILLLSLLTLSIVTAGARISVSDFTPFFKRNGLSSIGTAMALVVWAYFGYENVPNLAGEFRDLQRDMRRSVFYSVIIISILYVSVSVVTVGTGAYSSGNGLAPFAVILSGVFGKYGELAAGAIALVAIFSTMNAYMAGVGRLIHEVSRNGGFPGFISGSENKDEPGRSMILIGILASVFLILFWLFNIQIEDAFLIVSGIGVVTYIVGSAAGIKLLEASGWKKVIPWISLIISIILIIFIGKFMIISAAVILLSLAYTIIKERTRKADYMDCP